MINSIASLDVGSVTEKLVGRVGVSPTSPSPLLGVYLFNYPPKMVRWMGYAPIQFRSQRKMLLLHHAPD